MSGRALTIAVLVVVLGGLAVGAAGLSGVHGTHVDVTPQVVSDGQVVIDGVNSATGGFLVLHRNDGGDPGEPIGSVALESGFTEDLTVDVSDSLDGQTTLWAVVHSDDGDGTFEPDSDQPIRSLGGIAGRQFQVRSGDRPVYLLTHSANAQPSNQSVMVTAAALDGPGHVAIYTDDRGQLGEAVGNRSLAAGLSRNVVVNVSNATYDGQRRYYRLWAVLYEDDGDGTFEPDGDRPVTVGGERVEKRFQTRLVEEVPPEWVRGGPTPAPPTGIPGGAEAASTASDGSGGDGTSGGPRAGSGADSGETAGGSGPGFGVSTAFLAVLVALGLAVRRR